MNSNLPPALAAGTAHDVLIRGRFRVGGGGNQPALSAFIYPTTRADIAAWKREFRAENRAFRRALRRLKRGIFLLQLAQFRCSIQLFILKLPDTVPAVFFKLFGKRHR